MFLKMKKKISDLFDTINEMLEVLTGITDPRDEIRDCLYALKAISDKLNKEDDIPTTITLHLNNVTNMFNKFLSDTNIINEKSVGQLRAQVSFIKRTFNEEINAKLNIAFFPYKASMWDSLATIYEAAAEDKDCVVHVVPIPYYDLSENNMTPVYEGEKFPENLNITHWTQYNLEEQQPDIIFVHNIYDQFNTLTRVYEQYYTSNLVKYTDMLVYVPYYIASFVPFKKGKGFYPYNLPTIRNVDKVIYVNEYEKQEAIREGISEDKILVLGSPKLDRMIMALKEDMKYPMEWRDKIEGKQVYLINTGCLYFANNPFQAMEQLIDFFNITRFIDNTAVIWRPHPLTKISVIKHTPYFKDYYLNLTENILKGDNEFYQRIILDETDDYIQSLKIADVLISNDSSILNSYLITEKKVLFWGEKMPEDSLLPSNVFYYAFNKAEPWYQLAKKFSEGYDPLNINRRNMVSKVYVNADGTAGKKVYTTIKQEYLEKLNK